MTKHELFWKEVVFLTLVAIFSLTFFERSDNPQMYWGFIFLGVAFYWITMVEEGKIKRKKKLYEYFEYTSTIFLLSTVFFIVSYLILYYTASAFLMLTLSVGVILFSLGFMRLLFIRIK